MQAFYILFSPKEPYPTAECLKRFTLEPIGLPNGDNCGLLEDKNFLLVTEEHETIIEFMSSMRYMNYGALMLDDKLGKQTGILQVYLPIIPDRKLFEKVFRFCNDYQYFKNFL